FKERQRLFSLPKSTWKSYEGISDGGGVFDRSAKEIHCSKPMQDLLGISSSIVSGNELIQAILTMSVDLLWFGGIGTYIKASTESHIDVGDPTNNAVRVNATQVQAAIIGEGANLGITQKARIEYERNNGRINTDAIDNSAGVNMSDYEVNIKIILSTLLQQGHIQSTDERNRLLEDATDQVTALVLKNNVAQHELISMDRYRSMDHPFMIDHTISTLIQLGQLNHIDEQIPTSKERHELYRQSLGLPRCVLAKCQAYTKMRIKNALANATLFQGARYTELYVAYFPTYKYSLVPPSEFPDHQLKHDIIITELTNHFVGVYGCSAYESMTFSNTIPIDQAMHHLWLLEERFNIPEKRQRLIGTPTEIQDLVRLNNDLLYAILLCHVMNFSPETASSTAVNDETPPFPLAIQCLLMVPTYSNTTRRLTQLEDRIGFMSNLNQLMDLAVSSQVMQDQKISVLTDLYQSIIQALILSDQQWDHLLAQSDTLSPPISSNKDRLASLFLYSYRLRHTLIKIID
ncbi:MAG: NAD-glutamate dehydrogenase domain-containing protein, partial [Candidatus Marinamargulisbacteria bacterium]